MRMCIIEVVGRCDTLKRRDFGVRDGLRSVKCTPDDFDDAWGLEDQKSLIVTKSSKTIARKQRPLYSLPTILPLADAHAERKERLDASLHHLLTDDLLRAGACPKGVPSQGI